MSQRLRTYGMYFCFACTLMAGMGCSHLQQKEDESLCRIADNLRLSGNKNEAISMYKQFLKKSPNKLPIYLKLGETQIENGQLDEARRTFEEALPLDQNYQVKKRLARCYILAGLIDVALPIYKEILSSTNNSDVDAYNGMGMVYELQGNDKEAIKAYQAALVLEPNNESVQSNLGLSLAFSGRHAESLKWLVPIGEKLNATPKQRHNLAVAYALAGQENKARVLFSKSLSESQIEENLNKLRELKLNFGHRIPISGAIPMSNEPIEEK